MDIKEAHKYSSNNRKDLEVSGRCGCFYCLSIFSPTKIKEWTDKGTTALCPKCGVDSVLGNKVMPITKKFLKEMYNYWFSPVKKVGK